MIYIAACMVGALFAVVVHDLVGGSSAHLKNENARDVTAAKQEAHGSKIWAKPKLVTKVKVQ